MTNEQIGNIVQGAAKMFKLTNEQIYKILMEAPEEDLAAIQMRFAMTGDFDTYTDELIKYAHENIPSTTPVHPPNQVAELPAEEPPGTGSK